MEKCDLNEIIVHLKQVHPEINSVMSVENFQQSLKNWSWNDGFSSDYEIREPEEPQTKKAKVRGTSSMNQ